ncbi:hypothetical protein M501DRAFT_985486 [Patellaria atrata CBS 101060]|uniref:Uncharacterized protein n=1 Tax=Patellaria atrata CBS 101060 TaxID=1346257 RepID=A0A9P4SK94_9PEZI|nr:hypothetical protein M501DRAFT_985486 [Patellaria atrata CBS 101060]
MASRNHWKEAKAMISKSVDKIELNKQLDKEAEIRNENVAELAESYENIYGNDGFIIRKRLRAKGRRQRQRKENAWAGTSGGGEVLLSGNDGDWDVDQTLEIQKAQAEGEFEEQVWEPDTELEMKTEEEKKKFVRGWEPPKRKVKVPKKVPEKDPVQSFVKPPQLVPPRFCFTLSDVPPLRLGTQRWWIIQVLPSCPHHVYLSANRSVRLLTETKRATMRQKRRDQSSTSIAADEERGWAIVNPITQAKNKYNAPDPLPRHLSRHPRAGRQHRARHQTHPLDYTCRFHHHRRSPYLLPGAVLYRSPQVRNFDLANAVFVIGDPLRVRNYQALLARKGGVIFCPRVTSPREKMWPIS